MLTTSMKESMAHPLNQPEDYENLTEREKTVLQLWIAKHVQPAKRPSRRTDYSLKHDFEFSKREGGFYVTVGSFKGGMLAAGYKPVQEDVETDVNWRWYAKFEKWKPSYDF